MNRYNILPWGAFTFYVILVLDYNISYLLLLSSSSSWAFAFMLAAVWLVWLSGCGFVGFFFMMMTDDDDCCCVVVVVFYLQCYSVINTGYRL